MSRSAGPFYLIVEYCEHGSLRNFLRKCRQVESAYLQEKLSRAGAGEPQAPDRVENEYYITSRDLMSFAWQIAKGMQYLRELKVMAKFEFTCICI